MRFSGLWRAGRTRRAAADPGGFDYLPPERPALPLLAAGEAPTRSDAGAALVIPASGVWQLRIYTINRGKLEDFARAQHSFRENRVEGI